MATRMVTPTHPPTATCEHSIIVPRSHAPLVRRSSSFNITKVSITWLRGHPGEFTRQQQTDEMRRRLELRRPQLGERQFAALMDLKVRALLNPDMPIEAILEATLLTELVTGQPLNDKFVALYSDATKNERMPDDWERLFSLMD